MQLPSVGSTDSPVEICRRARTCSLETRVRRRNRGLSRRSEDYDVRILPTAITARFNFPAIPIVKTIATTSFAIHDPPKQRGRIHAQVSGPFASLRLRLVRCTPKLYHADPSLFLLPSLSASIVRCMYPPGSCWNKPGARTMYQYQPSSIQAMPYLRSYQLSLLHYSSRENFFLIRNRSSESERTEVKIATRRKERNPNMKSYLKYL